jgi:hypothetical protein
MTADPRDDAPYPTNWTGWIAFAAAMIMLTGTFNIIQGVVALLDDGFLLTTSQGLTVDVSYTTLGWLQIGLGAVSFAIGVGMLVGSMVALVAAVIVAGVSAIVHLAAIAAYPAWSVVVIAFDVIVVYAIAAHGREMKLLRRRHSSPDTDEEAWIANARR